MKKSQDEGGQILPICSFEPIVDNNCKLLILGTMPGVASLEKQQYYAYKYNAFWPLIYALFGMKPEEEYAHKKAFLLEKGIALWDVLKFCEREGSSDSKIKNPVPNDFFGFYRRYPGIRSVCFNGGPAARLYSRFIEKVGESGSLHSFYRLPSTSPAYTISFEKKLEQWKLLLPLLD